MNAKRIWLLAFGVLLAGCGGNSTSSAPPQTPVAATPTPLLDPFPTSDVPVSKAPAGLRDVWRPYQVLIIPNRHVPDSAPPPPAVLNATAGLVPDTDAQHWAVAFYRAQAWRKWGAAHAQKQFLQHIDKSGQGSGEFDNGATETIPDCALFPTAMTLVVDPSDGDHDDKTQFAFLTTYTGPCTAVYNLPDGTQKVAFTVGAADISEHYGSMHSDPLLGDTWWDINSGPCENIGCYKLPNPLPPPRPMPPLPAAASPFTAAAPDLQLFWKPYQVSVIPAKTLLSDIPALPPLDNRTHGIVDAPTAELWERGLMRAAAYATFSWSNLQLTFQGHVAAGSFYNTSRSLTSATENGGKPAMLPCDLFPTSLVLQPVTSEEQDGAVGYSNRVQWEFIATYKRPCTIQISFANGTSGSADMPGTLTLYGAYREDPVLGNLWYADSTRKPKD